MIPNQILIYEDHVKSMCHNVWEKLTQHEPILICRILKDLDHFMIILDFFKLTHTLKNGHLFPIARNPKLRGPHSYIGNKRTYGTISDLGSIAKHIAYVRALWDTMSLQDQLNFLKISYVLEGGQHEKKKFAGDHGNENRRPIISPCAFLICTVVPSIMLGIKWWPYPMHLSDW